MRFYNSPLFCCRPVNPPFVVIHSHFAHSQSMPASRSFFIAVWPYLIAFSLRTRPPDLERHKYDFISATFLPFFYFNTFAIISVVLFCWLLFVLKSILFQAIISIHTTCFGFCFSVLEKYREHYNRE